MLELEDVALCAYRYLEKKKAFIRTFKRKGEVLEMEVVAQ